MSTPLASRNHAINWLFMIDPFTLNPSHSPSHVPATVELPSVDFYRG